MSQALLASSCHRQRPGEAAGCAIQITIRTMADGNDILAGGLDGDTCILCTDHDRNWIGGIEAGSDGIVFPSRKRTLIYLLAPFFDAKTARF